MVCLIADVLMVDSVGVACLCGVCLVSCVVDWWNWFKSDLVWVT